MNDIFLDNDFIVHNFKKPDNITLDLIKWLYDEDDLDDKAFLVVSQKLYMEYVASASPVASYTNILSIYAFMQAQGRLNFFDNNKIKEFKTKYITKKVSKRLLCNKKDRDHIPVILLSNRKFAITQDESLLYDLNNFKGFNVTAVKSPDEVQYK